MGNTNNTRHSAMPKVKSLDQLRQPMRSSFSTKSYNIQNHLNDQIKSGESIIDSLNGH